MHEPDTPIVTLISLKETGPAVFALLVLRAFRAPKGDLSLNDTAIPIIPCLALNRTAWYTGILIRIVMKTLRNAKIYASACLQQTLLILEVPP